LGPKIFFKYVVFLLLVTIAINLIRKNELGAKNNNNQNMLILLVEGLFFSICGFPPEIASISLIKYHSPFFYCIL